MQIIGRPSGMNDEDWIRLGDVLFQVCREAYRDFLHAKDGPAAVEADASLNMFFEHLALWLVASEQEVGNQLSYDDAFEEAWVITRSYFDDPLNAMLGDERKR
jgi:hypothetical protein